MSGNLSPLVVQTAEALPLSLLVDGDIVLSETYHPGNGNLIQIDFRDVVESYLSFSFPSDDVYKQPTLARTFNAMFDGHTVSFTVVRSGKAHLNESASSFLKGNFLTWQPTTKYVTYYSPEWLTYFAVESCSIVLKAYFSGGETQLISLTSLSAGSCVTVNLQYAVVCGKLSNRRPMYYDVWAQGSSGARLTYIQRYMASAPQSPDESWYLFENSLGGLDSLRAYGSLDFAPEFEHQIAQTSDGLQEYRIDTSRVYTRYTGYLNPAEAKWLQDLFSARQKYAYTHSGYYRIVFTSSDGAYSGADMPSSYSFSYRFAEGDPFLDIQRDEDLPGNIEIALPDQEAFFLPPRLAEYPKLERNDDTLLLAQQPHTQEWGTLTFASIYEAILNDLIAKLDGLDITPCQGGGTGDSLWQKITLDESGAPLPVNEQYLTPIDPIDVKVPNNFYAAGDVICMASEPAIDSTELPVAGYGVSNFGLTALKQGGGLLVDADNLIYVDPSFAGGGGGLNKEELEKYLKDNKYYNYQTALEGYVLPETYTPITAQDTILSAFGKLERNFDNYVTIATDQTITGSKRFKKTVISEDDVICMASDPAIPSSELPIATKTAIGMIKVGPTLTVSEDGQLDTAGESITGVHWDDIIGPPSTFPPSSHTHTVSQISNFPTYWDWNYIDNKPSTFTPSYHTHTISQITNIDQANVATAKKLAQYVYLWGNLFNGSSDVSGDLSGVGDITPSSNGSYNLGSSGYRFARLYLTGNNGNWILGKTDGAITIDSANSSTSTYFPLLRMKAYTGRVFNIGLFQGNDLGHQFGFFMYDPDRTSNGTDAEFYMNSYGNMRGSGSLIMTGDVMCMSSSPEISSSELPVATSNTLGLIKVGSTLKISNGVLNVASTGSGGGSDVRFGLYDDNYVTLHVDNSYYELSRRRHKHSVTTSGSGNAVTSISFGTDGGMTLKKGSTFSLSGHTHSQYLTSHQTIYSLTIKQNGTTLGTYTPNSGSKTINITTSGGSSDWDGGSISNTIEKGDGYFLRGTGGAGYRLYLDYNDAEAYVNSGRHFQWYSGTVKAMQVGNGYNYAETNWQTGSDIRKKNRLDNVYNVLDNMTRVDVFRYTWKHIENSNTYIGVGAQLVESIFPDVVSYNQEYDTYSVDYSAIGCIAFQGVKELYTLQKQTTNDIDLLKQRIALLEAENLNLWNALNKEAA